MAEEIAPDSRGTLKLSLLSIQGSSIDAAVIPEVDPKRNGKYATEYQLDGEEVSVAEDLLKSVEDIDHSTVGMVRENWKVVTGIDVVLELMERYAKKDYIDGNKESITMDQYIRILRENGLPWLLEK